MGTWAWTRNVKEILAREIKTVEAVYYYVDRGMLSPIALLRSAAKAIIKTLLRSVCS